MSRDIVERQYQVKLNSKYLAVSGSHYMENAMRELCIALARAKDKLAMVKREISDLESQIASVFNDDDDKLEGSSTIKIDGYKVVATKKLTRKLDYSAYLEMDLPEGHQFVDLKPSINLKRLRAVEQVDPGVVEACVTITPAKTAIKVTEEDM